MSEQPRETHPGGGEDHGRSSDERFRLLVESVRDYAIFMLDAHGHVLTWNAGAERFKGYRAQEIIGQHFSRFYPAEARARSLPEHELEVAKATGSFEDEGWRVRKDGSLFWANVVITAMRDSSGTLIGFAKVTRDLTQRRNHEEALRQSEERFRLLVEGVADYAIFMLDANGKVMTWNVGAQRIKGYTPDQIIGKHFSVFYPEEARESGWPDHELQVAAEQGSFADEGWRLRADGTPLWANVTITALRDASGRLIGFAKLTRDLTERRRAQAAERASRHREEVLEAERDARMAAQRATRIKDEFLATLSHELRTPLSAILGWTQVLSRRGAALEAGELKQAIDVIERNARVQVRLIDDMLDLNRIMAGKVRLELQQVSLAEIVQAAVQSAEPSAKAKRIGLELVLDSPTSLVDADPARLQQVIWNLLTNAVKFTPNDGRITVQLRRAGSRAELSIADTGIGIPTSFLPHVFDRFSQKDGSTTRAYGGLGLGLAIARQLAELHGGSIRATSAGEGLGSTFFVDLPLVAPAVADDASHHLNPTATAVGEVASLPRLTDAHVFVIDDETDARDLLQRVLQDQGARVTAFASAEDALVAVKTAMPALIVCDIGMPGMDGYQFMRALRAGEALREQIPAIALTAFARSEDYKQSLVAGYQAHLAKPFDIAELVLLAADLVRS